MRHKAQDLRVQDLRVQDLRVQDLRVQDLRVQDLRVQAYYETPATSRLRTNVATFNSRFITLALTLKSPGQNSISTVVARTNGFTTCLGVDLRHTKSAVAHRVISLR